ncbi:MAG: DUF4255 domain-containing protein [Lewinellaceae bacterium]|nr:DUF4255 domain-containing protein [Lewinellaceae bacterium]
MIKESILFISKEVEAYTNLAVVLDHAHTVEEKSGADSKITLALVNVHEEATLKNLPNFTRQNGVLKQKEAPVFLNLYLLFIANNSDYATCLQVLSGVAECFQSKPFFTASNKSNNNPATFPQEVDRLIFELYNLTLEQINHLWGVNGGKYYPSLLYKARIVKIERKDAIQDGPEIKDIQVETGLL